MASHRLSPSAAERLLREGPLIEVMARADAVRRRLHPTDDVTFVVDTNPNYTNVCVTKCTFCSFHRRQGDPESWTLTPDEVGDRAARAQRLGATTILLQGGHHPGLPFDYYLAVIAAIGQAAPGLHRHLFSPPEIAHIAAVASMTPRAVLERFREAGLETMPGGGAEILVDRVRRRVSPGKISADTWLDVMREAHAVGFRTSATMTYGHRETDADIVEHLVRLRGLQDETGGFLAFIPWSFKPGSSPLARRVPEAELPSRYARVIAVSRLVLDNVPHVQASWFGEGWRAGQLALHAGADDFGGLLLEENVLFEARHRAATTLASVLTTIRGAGFTPVQRTTLYEKIRRHPDIGDEDQATAPEFMRVPGVGRVPVAGEEPK